MVSFKNIIALWPSPADLAKEVGAGVEAVMKWRYRNNIPAEWWERVAATDRAKAANVTIEEMASMLARSTFEEPTFETERANR